MATTASECAVSLKLQIIVDKKKNRVMFAEAKKDFVDFIFHILNLPLGAVQRVLTSTSILGSIGTLREGLTQIDAEYLEYRVKDYLLDAVKAPYHGKNNGLLLPETTSSKYVYIYICNCNSPTVLHQTCRQCTNSYSLNTEGYVKGLVTFMVLDDLTVRLATPTSIFSVMRELSIKDVDATEKREVTFGPNEAINLLKASLTSKTVLTDVFLPAGSALKAEK